MLCLSGFELYSRWVPLLMDGVVEFISELARPDDQMLSEIQLGRSTEQAIAEITDNLKNAIGVFLEFVKAFDKVNPIILFDK